MNALHLALEALKGLVDVGYWADHPRETEAGIAAIAAIEAASAQEPVAWMLIPKVQRHPQKPITRGCYTSKPTTEEVEFAELDGDKYIPLYAAPQGEQA